MDPNETAWRQLTALHHMAAEGEAAKPRPIERRLLRARGGEQ